MHSCRAQPMYVRPYKYWLSIPVQEMIILHLTIALHFLSLCLRRSLNVRTINSFMKLFMYNYFYIIAHLCKNHICDITHMYHIMVHRYTFYIHFFILIWPKCYRCRMDQKLRTDTTVNIQISSVYLFSSACSRQKSTTC